MLAQVDFSSLTSSMTAEFAGILGLGLGVAVAVVGLFAAPQGIKFARRMWEAIAGDSGSSPSSSARFEYVEMGDTRYGLGDRETGELHTFDNMDDYENFIYDRGYDTVEDVDYND